jgi:DNA-binding NarL/FixJ family response regulator
LPSAIPKAAAAMNLQIVLVAVGDLLFSSKIRTVAKQAGVDVTFARTPPEILEQMRTLKPDLVIFDLNSAKADPINTVATIKGDPDIASIRTVGFVSHVDSATIGAARDAGVDEVMPRSAFAAQLADVLLAGSRQR